jgi:hypothetical protein
MTYTIIETIKNDTTIKFTFDDSTTSTQTIHGVPSDETQEDFINNYAAAYLAGLEIENA